MFGLLTHDLKDEKYYCPSIKEKIMISIVISINRIEQDAIQIKH